MSTKTRLAMSFVAAALLLHASRAWAPFHFVVIDEAFGRGSDASARFGLDLFKKMGLQLLIVTPLQKIHIIEPYVSAVGFVHNEEGRRSRLRNLTIEMLACYRGRDWDGALAAIERGRRSDDGEALGSLYKLYEARIRDYMETPPPEDWNGAFALLTK